jgi:hypothetical protein
MEKETSIIKELKEKYDVVEIINTRYDGNEKIVNFYNQYYDEIEKLEKIGFEIWKMFGEMWKEEKQSLILEILKLSLFLEKEGLKIKRTILKLISQNDIKNNKVMMEDKNYLINLVEKSINTNSSYIAIDTPYEDLCDKYHINREKFKNEIEEEFNRLKEEENHKINKKERINNIKSL